MHENQPDQKGKHWPGALGRRYAPRSLTCPNATRAVRWGMIRFLARRVLNYIVLLALASFLTFSLTSLYLPAAGQPAAAQPTAPQAVIDAKADELDLDKPIPVRYGKWVSGAVRGDFGTTVTGQPMSARAVAPRRGQPAAAGHRFGAGHRASASWPGRGARSASTGCRPRHHHAVAAGAQHADIRHRQPADPGRAAGELGPRRADLFEYTGETSPWVDGGWWNQLRRPAAAPGPADADAGAGSRSPDTAATSATRCSTCSARTSSAPRAPRG